MSLFDMTPEVLQQQRQAAVDTAAQAYAQQGAQQRADAAGFQFGNALGRNVGSALGVEDKELLKVRDIQGMMKGIDINDPEALLSLSKQLGAKGYMAEGELAWKKANELIDTRLKQGDTRAGIIKKTAEANKDNATADKERAAVTAAEVKLADRKLALKAAGVPDEYINGIASDDKTFESYLKKAGTKVVEADGRQKLVDENTGKLIADIGAAPDRSTRISVDARTQGESAFSKKMGELDASKVDAATTQRTASLASIEALNKLESLDDSGVIGGTFASGRVGATNFLTTLGLASKADQAKLAASEQFSKVAGDVILGALGGKLGAGISEGDRAFIQNLVPQLENSAAARRALITFMKKKNADVVEETNRLEDYARTHNTLNGYKPKMELSPKTAASTGPDLSSMSDAELKAAIAAARAKKAK